MSPDAPTHTIRSSYRARARLHHPDRGVTAAGDDAASMAEINEAYRVLSDPGRRANYDRMLTARPADGAEARPEAETDGEPRRRPTRPERVLAPDGPARYPWKPMLVVAVVGSALVLVSAAMADPPGEEVPDGIIRTDSCVVIEPNGDAREVACTGDDDDIVVELFVPTDARCPARMQGHRDRLGLGVACVIP